MTKDVLSSTIYAAVAVDPNTLLVDHGFDVFEERDIVTEGDVLVEPGTKLLVKLDRTSRSKTRCTLLPPNTLKPTFTYRSEVLRVVDGDTYWLKAFLWKGCSRNVEVRLDGINTPESSGPKASPQGFAAKQFVSELLTPGREVVVRTRKVDVRLVGHGEKVEVHGRYLADVFLDGVGGQTLTQRLITLGYGVEYHGVGKV